MGCWVSGVKCRLRDTCRRIPHASPLFLIPHIDMAPRIEHNYMRDLYNMQLSATLLSTLLLADVLIAFIIEG
jgi:hypothetical protein